MKPINSLLFSILMISSSSALAEKMDLETHDIVINKLEAVINEKPQPSIDNSPIMIRLADLYAERARLKSLSEGDQDCNNCLKSNEDRTKALNFYDKAFKFTDSQTQGSVLMQMAHLNQILGRQKSSMNLFEKIIKNRKRYSAKTVGQAHAGLGEVYFKKGQFKKASELYQKAINISATPKKPFLKYRLAWSLRNSGKPIPATITLKALLTSRKSLENAKDTGLDKAFWADGAQDLASFMAHQNVTRKQIAELQSLSPEEQKWSNVYALGKELDRLGKKKQSLIVWDVYMLNPKVSTQEKLEIQIRSAQAYFDLNQKTKAVELHKKTLTDWQNLDCDDDDEIVCADIKTRLRNFVTLWNKAEGPKPTQQLLKAYINYLKVFGDDLQMGYWAAGIARKIKNNFVAIGLYKETAYLAKSQKNEKILNGSLMAEIQIAELTKNLDKKEAAYKRYLELKPNGPKAAEMKYQLTQVSYDRKQYAKSAEEFKALADNKKMSGAFAVKAADLAIDSLALLKDDQRIQAWTTELAKKYPQRRKEFNKIHRQSVLNEVATRISTKKVDNSALQGSMNQLRALSLKNASDKEIKSYWQNRLIIAEKTKNLSEVRLCARKIIGFKFFNKKEKERARELIVWSNEMEFRFKAAYESAKKLTSYQTKTSQFQLKLAVLAELGGQKSAAEKHYRSFIKKTPSLRKANQVRAQLIEKSRRPWRELEKNLAKLKRTPDILSTALMQAYYKKRDKKKLDKILRSSKANRYPEGKALQRLLVIDEINKFNKEISRHRITSRNMNKSLPERLKLLKKAENWASRLSKQNDWTLQILAVDIVAKQNSRTYRNILALRTPKGLNAQQRAEYQTLLKQKASAFSQKAGIANTTLDRLWNQAESWTQIESEIAIANKAARSLMVNELSELKKRATSKGKEKITQIIVKKATKPSQKALVSAYVEAKKDPFDWKIIERIKNMETQFDRKTLVNYLESRMNELKKGAL